MAALGCVYVLALLFFHLAQFPGLYTYRRLEPGTFSTLVREKVCTFQASNFFINLPLAFYLHVHPIANCDRTKVITVQDCLECPNPPYFAWTITSLPAE